MTNQEYQAKLSALGLDEKQLHMLLAALAKTERRIIKEISELKGR